MSKQETEQKKSISGDDSCLPFVTVIMPVRNESGYVHLSLSSVINQNYPASKFEVIVADGMSSDGTREILKSFEERYSNIRMIDNPRRIVSTGLNKAIEKALGDVIVRVDGHCQIDASYIRKCVEHLRSGTIQVVGGPLETCGDNWLAQQIASAMSSPFGVGGTAFRTVKNETRVADTVAFPAFTKAIVGRAGAFDEELVRNQDDEYNYRIRKLGAKILLAKDVKCRYFSRTSLVSLFRQYFQYGYWKVRVLQKHPLQMKLRQFIPPLFVALLFVSTLLPLLPGGSLIPLVIATGSYLSVSLFYSLRTSTRSEPLSVMILPIVFATLHTSYGLGFVVGLVRFLPRWFEGAPPESRPVPMGKE